MAKQLTTASVATGLTIEAGHVTQSSVAFTGGEAYDITISGSLTTTGTNIMSSSASPSITSILTDNDSHPFITGVTTTGPNFRMNLADANSSGSAYMAFGRQTGNFGGTGFTAQYATGSNASEGEIVMSIGKNGPLGGIEDRFIVQSEPGPIGSNTFSELSLLAGTHSGNRRVVQMVVQNGTNDFADVTVGNQDITTGYKKHVLLSHAFNGTSSIAGFASSSLNTGSTARNFNANSIPFGIVAGGFSTAELVDTVFFVDRGGSLGSTFPVTASFEISRGGSINMEGHITASGNISASGDIVGATFGNSSGNIIFTGNVSGSGTNSSYFGDEYNAHGGDANSGFTLLSLGSKPSIHASGASLKIGNTTNSTQTGIDLIGEVTASGNISASGHLVVDEILIPTFKLITPVDKAASGAPLIKTTGDIDNTNAIVSLGDPDGGDTGAHIRIEPGSEKVTFQGLNTTITGSILTTAAGTFQGGKPITTHTSSPISSSLANAGKYHIVHGTLTASIVLDSAAPIGAEYEFFQTSSVGQFLFESASGTTVISKDGNLKLVGQGSAATLKKVATSTFHLVGDLTS